ncbi:MAG: hypothetical protein M5U09_30375, partial [Gammaproteobacteria bacterium]|nr:hypothetical protein [Gammaproteobacteria bacterium]
LVGELDRSGRVAGLRLARADHDGEVVAVVAELWPSRRCTWMVFTPGSAAALVVSIFVTRPRPTGAQSTTA